MTNSDKLWTPKTPLPEAVKAALTVPRPRGPMTPSLLRSLVETKLAHLISSNPTEAREAMEMSIEQAPELWTIAEQSAPKDWAALLTRSDGMERLLSLIDWPAEASATTQQEAPEQPEPQSLREILEQIAEN